MAYVVIEPCIRCKCADFAAARPVSCFYDGLNFLVIAPDECIDCDICVAEYPVEAICPIDHVPADQAAVVALNAEPQI